MSTHRTTHKAVHPATSEIERWAMALTGIDVVDVRRTSNKSRKDFLAMLQRGTGGRPDDPDVKKLAEYGHAIVLREGEALRRKLGAFTITRGSVDGSASRAVLGWAIPIGRTLFVLYLESGRKFDIPGPTPDQGMNAFAEALRALIRGTRPSDVYTPLLNRVFRLIDHAIPLMRTLRTYNVALHAEGSQVPLDTDDEKFMATIRAAIADKDAASTVARLEGDRLAIYERGEWFLGRQLLPFTGDTEWTMVHDPASGAMIRHDIDKHTIVPTAQGPKLLQLFVRLGGTPGVGRAQIALALGREGVLSRAPKLANQFITIDKLNNPRTAIDTLCTRPWVTAFQTGWYEKEVGFTSDLSSSFPNAPLRTDEQHRQWLGIRVRMPAPEGGWGISEQDWAAFEHEQFGTAGRKSRGGRDQATKGRLRPLLGLCRYRAGGVQKVVLGFESSGYQLCQRPATLAELSEGVPRAWGPEASWQTTVNAGDWHESLATALTSLGVEVADRLAPLMRHESLPLPDSARLRTERDLEEATVAMARLRNRITGIRQERQEVRGEPALDQATRDTKVALLKQEEQTAERELDEAATLCRDLQQRLENVDDDQAQEPESSDDLADFSSLELVIAALRRYRGAAPASLARVIKTLLDDSMRWELIDHGTHVSWSAQVHLPLSDGTLASARVQGKVPTSKGSSRGILIDENSERQQRLPKRARTATGSSADAYARRFFMDGASLSEIANNRDHVPHGGSRGSVYRDLRDWLLAHGVPTHDLARAALDMPLPGTRRALYRALTDDGTSPMDTFETFIGDVYRNGIPHPGAGQPRQTSWGVLWCAAPMLGERRVYEVLKNQKVPGALMSAAVAADAADIPYTTSGSTRAVGRGVSLLDMTNGGRRRRADGDTSAVLPVFLTKDWAIRDTRPTSKKRVGLRRCEHGRCSGHLLPVPVPEVPGMLLCDTCRRVPGTDTLVFPRGYLLRWSGGRRRRTGDGTYIGTVLQADTERAAPHHDVA